MRLSYRKVNILCVKSMPWKRHPQQQSNIPPALWLTKQITHNSETRNTHLIVQVGAIKHLRWPTGKRCPSLLHQVQQNNSIQFNFINKKIVLAAMEFTVYLVARKPFCLRCTPHRATCSGTRNISEKSVNKVLHYHMMGIQIYSKVSTSSEGYLLDRRSRAPLKKCGMLKLDRTVHRLESDIVSRSCQPPERGRRKGGLRRAGEERRQLSGLGGMRLPVWSWQTLLKQLSSSGPNLLYPRTSAASSGINTLAEPTLCPLLSSN